MIKQPQYPLRKAISLHKTESKKTRTTICLPIAMLEKIHASIEEEGISRKRRSQWIEMTVLRLLNKKNFQELVLEEFLEPGFNTTIPLSLSSKTKLEIDQTVDNIQAETHRSLEVSALIRTAISQHLIQRSSQGER